MIHNEFAGHFTLTVHNADGTVKETREFQNLITDNGLNLMAGSPPGFGWTLGNCQVGTASTPPVATNSTLGAFRAVAGLFNGQVSSGYNATDKYHWRRWVYRFNQGAAAGNLTEIGIGWSGEAQGNLFSHALIVDTSGAPTTLVITANEFLTVTYELRNYPKSGDVVTTATIDGVERTITVRPAQIERAGDWGSNIPTVNAYTGGQSTTYDGIAWCTGKIAAETTLPANEMGMSQNTRTWSTYVPNSFRRECVSVAGINDANGTLNSLTFNTGIGKWQVGFDPPIVKNNTMELRVTMAVSWGRYTP
ncbi:tail fiber [Stenotrophomonas phage BUCT598]|uniref:Tail fiber n=1 Tax=Stenotrophomonas phage BUCT598 TaxID=2834253 RepID=A0A8F2JCT8_9CAUD|nr:tail fiber [Stenotrophomonas phage BUCT598]